MKNNRLQQQQQVALAVVKLEMRLVKGKQQVCLSWQSQYKGTA